MLVNFTAYSNAANIGQNVDASSLPWRPGNTLAIFEMPLVIPPDIVYNGSIFTVDEDSGVNDFDVSTVEPVLTDTSLIWTSLILQFPWSRQNAKYKKLLSINLRKPIIWSLSNTDNRH